MINTFTSFFPIIYFLLLRQVTNVPYCEGMGMGYCVKLKYNLSFFKNKRTKTRCGVSLLTCNKNKSSTSSKPKAFSALKCTHTGEFLRYKKRTKVRIIH